MVLSTMLIIILTRISLISHGKKNDPTGKCHIPKTGTCIEGSNKEKNGPTKYIWRSKIRMLQVPVETA